MKQFFVTGTDTNIGKTFISAILCKLFNFAYYKPIQSGTINGYDSEYVSQISSVKIIPETYALREALSPHLSAAIDGKYIDIQNIIYDFTKIQHNIIVEGAGGLFVPINENEFILDLMRSLNIPIIIVAENRLGCINQSLMAINAIRNNMDADIKCVILNNGYNGDNANSIQKYGQVEVLQFPKMNCIDFQSNEMIDFEQKISHILDV